MSFRGETVESSFTSFFTRYFLAIHSLLHYSYTKIFPGQVNMQLKFTVFFLFLTVFLSVEVAAQTVNFEDGFEDGDFTNNPAWSGDNNQFTVIDGEPNFLLQLQGDDQNGDVSYLSTPSTQVVGSWEFFIDLNYNPSDGNRADIFLMSDIQNLEGAVNGYAIRGGENGSNDVFRLVRYENGSEAATVLSGSTDISSGGGFRLKVTRASGGEWTLEVAQGYDGQLSSEGTATDNTFDTASYTGVRATYTSTRDDLFTFDYKIDLPPFTATQSTFNNSQVAVTFNRPYDQSTVQASDFNIDNGIGSPNSVNFQNATTVQLDYGNTNFSSGEYIVTVNDVDDQNGETIAGNTTTSFEILPFDVTASTINGSQVDVTFNRDYDPSTVQTSDFSIDNSIGSPGSVTFPNTTTVRLDYGSTNFPSDHYTVTINDVADQDGIAVPANTTSTFVIYGTYAQGDIIINEFAYDYPTSLSEEYIEIRNTSNKYLNLSDWQISDNNSTNALGSAPIPIEPDSFLVISADTTELFNVFGNRAYHEAGFPALNNTTPDAVQLITNNDAIADSLTYNSDWGGTDVALERRSATTPSIYQENWGNSPNTNGGTPGLSNEIAPDNTPPELSGLRIAGTQTIKLGFNERLESSTATDETNFSINGISISSATQTEADSVALSLGSSLQDAQRYTISVSGIEDIFSNAISSTDTTFTYYNPTPVDSGDVAINEFMSAPPSNSSEYIEIYNHSSKSLDLQGWTLSDAIRNQDVITNSQFIVPPDSFVVIAPENTLASDYPDIAFIVMSSFPSLNNGGDVITIRDSNGTLLDSLSYSSNWASDEVALERRSVDVSAIYQSNWGDAPNGFGTPGSANEIPTDTTPPELESLFIENNQLTITFSDPLDQASAENTGNYTLSGGASISNATFASPDSVFLTPGSNLQNNTSYTLSIENVADIFGNAIAPTNASFTFYEVSPSDSGDVAISEFMSAPPSNSSEYIEIYNHSSKSFDLQGWTLSDNTQNADVITNSQFIVPPDSFAVIAPDYTLQSNFPDIALVVMDEFPSLNNGGDQIIIKNNNTTLLDSLAYTSGWGSDEAALERRSIDVAGFYQSNWSESPNGFGTPGRANEVSGDVTAPQLTSFQIVNNHQLYFIFSERIKSSSINISDVSISGNTSVDNITLLPPDTLSVTLSPVLQNNSDYTISIEQISDIFDNTISVIDTTFTYYEVSPVSPGDIFVNEFSPNPVSGSTEYVEIYNPTSKSFDLQGWTLSDNRGNKNVITNSQFIIPPDSFAVVAPDNTLLLDHPDIALVSMPNFPSLNNSGDDIVLHDDNGTQLDSLQYTSGWGGNEVALERRTTTVSGTFQENWGNSPDGFGTPGNPNLVVPDETAPAFEELFTIDQSSLQLEFSERVTSSSASDEANYQINPNRDIQLIAANDDSVQLFLSQDLESGTTYEVTVSNISDVFGNTLESTTKQVEYLQVDQAQQSDIVINEILYNPGSTGKADFIELYNTSTKNVDLTNWVVGDASNTTSISQTIQLRAGEYIVLTGSSIFAANAGSNTYVISGFPSLNNNTPDAVYLRNQNGITIDSLRYSQSWGGNEEGTSLERKDPLAASNDASNWETSTSENGSTGGQQNITFSPDTSPPEVIFSKVRSDGTYEVQFNEFIKLTSDLQFLLGDQSLNIASFDSTNGNVIILNSPQSRYKKIAGNGTSITVQNLTDVKGNTAQQSDVAVAQPMNASEKDLVINEIMYNPLDESDDNQPDQSEYIELRNTRDYAISLEGLVLHDAPDEDDNIRELQPVSSTAKWVPPQGKVLVYADDATTFAESMIANFFDLEPSNLQSIMQINRSSLSLASSGDAIFISDSTGANIDSVFYDETWQNPNLIDTRGVSLERITPSGPSNDDSNWGSSVNSKGGTPNQENSIYQGESQVPDETGISFTPNPFTPDGNGNNDNLFINYKLDHQDYLIKVHIYDRYGRMVRELADGKQAGFEGQLIWDGRKGDGGRKRIGIYIVVFEAYNSASGSDKAFKKTVVLARPLK